jgi:hypothetical protein
VRTTLDNLGRLWIFTDTLHPLSPTQIQAGVGVTRLTRRGLLDTGFGTQGLSYFPADHFNSLIGAQSVNGLTYMGFATYGTDADPGVTWEVCRLNANGALDNSWFGSGCATLTTDGYRQQSDLVVDPVTGYVWIVGVGQTQDNIYQHALFGLFDNANHHTEVQRYYAEGKHLRALQAVPDGSGGLYFSGALVTSVSSNDVLMGHVAKQPGGTYATTLGTPVTFTTGGDPAQATPACIQLTAQGKLQLGVNVNSLDGHWGTVQFLADGSRDMNYGNNGATLDVVADTARGNSFGIADCRRGADGRLDMVGAYTFKGIVEGTFETVPTVHRMQAGGFPDQAFGGDSTLPGTTFPMAYPGTAMNNFRSFTPPQPRTDVGTSIQVQPNGMLLVGGMSLRGDGVDNHYDVAVMRVQDEDAIFTDGME